MSDIRKPEFWKNLLGKILRQILDQAGLYKRASSHNQHVVPHEEGWAVKGAGNERYTAVFDRQEQAIERAREIAKNYRSSVVIHRKDGSIREQITYRDYIR